MRSRPILTLPSPLLSKVLPNLIVKASIILLMNANQDGRLTSSFRKQRVIGPLHTGGPVIVTSDAKRIVTCLGEQAILTNVENGHEICRFYNDTTSVTAMTLSPSEKELVVITSSLSIRIYAFPSLYSLPITKPLEPSRHIPKAHEAPVHVATTDPSSNYIATGSADGVAKVWDLHRGYVTHVFKGHGGVISCLRFHLATPYDEEDEGSTPQLILATGSVDTRVRLFDLGKSNLRSSNLKPVAVLDGHVSVPRGIAFSPDGLWMITAGRDSVVLIWRLNRPGSKGSAKSKGDKVNTLTPTLTKTIPVSEAIESLGIIDNVHAIAPSSATSLQFFIGGEKGSIHVWDAHQAKRLRTLEEQQSYQSDDAKELRAIQEAIYCPAVATVVSIHADQNILFHSLQSLSTTRHLIGFNDEIVDAVFLSPQAPDQRDTYLALATNSSLLRIYSSSDADGLNSHLLSGHADTILALDCSSDGQILVSCGKDKMVLVWAPVKDVPGQWGCVATGSGHAESVGALAISRKAGPPNFLVTGSQDRTIKLWDLSSIPSTAHIRDATDDASVGKLQSLVTQKAHEKDVNSLDISPNDGLLATGSQDKTAKIFEIKYQKGARASLNLFGTLKGHKRGVWNVKFSRTEKLIATASGDKSVKLWTLDDYSCIKTFEGHTNSVLRVNFINKGQQLLTTASDGLLKLWSVRGEECVATMDNHEDKIWALAISQDEKTVVTAGADSVVTFWQDSTESEQREKDEKREELVAKEQDLANYVALQDYKNAIFLALSMDHPRRLYNLFNVVSNSRVFETFMDDETGEILGNIPSSSITGNPAVDEVLRTLPFAELAKLLRYVRDWNTTARTSGVAQVILHAIVKLRPASDIHAAFNHRPANFLQNDPETKEDSAVKQGEGLRDVMDALIPYTERHLDRTDRLVQESYILDLLLSEMDGGMGLDDEPMEVDL